MNCQPLDLAIVVRTRARNVRVPDELLGAPVTVLELHHTQRGPLWILKEPIAVVLPRDAMTPHGLMLAGKRYWVCALPDAVLQPMRSADGGADSTGAQEAAGRVAA